MSVAQNARSRMLNLIKDRVYMTSKMKCTKGKYAHVAACTKTVFGERAQYVCEKLSNLILKKGLSKKQALLELEALKAKMRPS